mgnify:CR=1 FL=1
MKREILKIKVIGNIPKTLKFTQRSVDCVLHIISFKIARAIKKPNVLKGSGINIPVMYSIK